MGLLVTDRYYEHIPERVLNVNGATIMWDVPVITDSTIVANRPDIVKGKSVPLEDRRGPEDSRKLRFPDFVTMAQDCGKVFSRTHRPSLPPGNTPCTHFC